MRIVGIACVRDEEDVIESFVRHNIVYLDKIYIIDNLSRDKTAGILSALAQEGLPIEVWESSSCSHQQELAMTAALRKLAKFEPDADFAFLLDADEFLGAPSRAALIDDLEKLKAGRYGLMPWKTYVPVDENLDAIDTSIPVTARMTHRRAHEGKQMFKAVVPRELFSKASVRAGNHHLLTPRGGRYPKQPMQSPLAHFPVRSASQLIAKIILSSHSMKIKKNAPPREAFHWMQMAEAIRAKGFNISRDQIIDFVLEYSIQSNYEKPKEFLRDPLPVHPSVMVRYSSDGSGSLIRRFDQYIIRLLENNHVTPIKDSDFERREFHLIREIRASFKKCKRWVKRRLGLQRKEISQAIR